MSYDTHEVLQRLQAATGSKNDKELAAKMDIRPATLSEWKRRGRVDWERIISTFPNVSIDSLLGRAVNRNIPLSDSPLVLIIDNKTLGIR